MKRQLKIYSRWAGWNRRSYETGSGAMERNNPCILLTGKYLEENGFKIGDNIEVEIDGEKKEILIKLIENKKDEDRKNNIKKI